MHDVIVVGIPLIAILAGILFNRNDMRDLKSEMRAELHRLSGKIDAVESKMDKVKDTLDSKIDEVRDAGHRDSLEILRALTALHERVAIVEDRQNR